MWPRRAAVSSYEELQQIIIDQDEDFADKGYVCLDILERSCHRIVLAESSQR